MSDSWRTYRLPLLMREPSGQSIAHLGGRSEDDSCVALARSYGPSFLAWSARDLFFGITANLEAPEGSLGHQLLAVERGEVTDRHSALVGDDEASGNDQDHHGMHFVSTTNQLSGPRRAFAPRFTPCSVKDGDIVRLSLASRSRSTGKGFKEDA